MDYAAGYGVLALEAAHQALGGKGLLTWKTAKGAWNGANKTLFGKDSETAKETVNGTSNGTDSRDNPENDKTVKNKVKHTETSKSNLGLGDIEAHNDSVAKKATKQKLPTGGKLGFAAVAAVAAYEYGEDAVDFVSDMFSSSDNKPKNTQQQNNGPSLFEQVSQGASRAIDRTFSQETLNNLGGAVEFGLTAAGGAASMLLAPTNMGANSELNNYGGNMQQLQQSWAQTNGGAPQFAGFSNSQAGAFTTNAILSDAGGGVSQTNQMTVNAENRFALREQTQTSNEGAQSIRELVSFRRDEEAEKEEANRKKSDFF
jgi:hypothetical protein